MAKKGNEREARKMKLPIAQVRKFLPPPYTRRVSMMSGSKNICDDGWAETGTCLYLKIIQVQKLRDTGVHA